MSGNEESLFMCSGNWWIENDKAWCIPCESNILLQIDMTTNKCEFIAELPNNSAYEYMRNCYFIKCENDIFCMPYLESDSIWVYQLEHSQFLQMKITNAVDSQKSLCISEFWRYDENIFAVSRGLKQILEISINEKKIKNYYSICDISNDEIANSIKVGQEIYSVSCSGNRVYQFDLESRKSTVYTIPNVDEKLYAIDFDGKHFWLSGYSKKIYVWNKDDNSTVMIDKFPEGFGIYNLENDEGDLLDCKSVEYNIPVFINITALEQYIWFIPLLTNKIIYVDKFTYEAHSLEIEEENETKSSWLTQRMVGKYALQYVRENRYLGLFSYKNNYVFEIDTLEKKVERKQYFFDSKFIQEMGQVYDAHADALSEHRGIDRLLFKLKLYNKGNEKDEKKDSNVGIDIHSKIMS